MDEEISAIQDIVKEESEYPMTGAVETDDRNVGYIG